MPPFINPWVLLIAMVLSVVLGFIWYGPLFGKKWMALSGIQMPSGKPSMKMMAKPIIYSLIGTLLLAFSLSSFVAFHDSYYNASGLGPALSLALFTWLGFIVPPYLNLTGWEGKRWTLFWINTGYWLVLMLIIGAIIAAFGG